jgi:putative redox protein
MHVEVIFDGEGSYAVRYEGRTIAPGPGPLPAPPVLFLGSVAACAGVFAVSYLKARNLAFDGLRVTGEAGHAEEPRRLSDLRIVVILPAPIDERHMAPLQRAVDLCTLKNSLMHPPSVIAEVRTPAIVS